MTEGDDYHQKLKGSWLKFIESGEIDESVVRKEIADSWRRCREYGVDPYQDLNTMYNRQLEDWEKRDYPGQKEFLSRIAHPFLETLFQLLKSSEVVILLTDEEGILLDALGEGGMWDIYNRYLPLLGKSVHEKAVGTTSVGIIIHTGQPIQVFAEEHFCLLSHKFSCSAAPIYDVNRRMCGIIDVTGEIELFLKHPHTLGMMVAAAKAIENQLHLSEESRKVALSNQYLQAMVNQMPKGIMIFDQQGRLTHLNNMVCNLFDIKEKEVIGEFFNSLLPSPSLIRLLESEEEYFFREVILEKGKKQARYLISVQKITNGDGEKVGKFMIIEEMKEIKKLVHRVIGATARYHFSDILGHSLAIQEVVNQGRVASQSISNVLILGESGTGKEMFAQSIHNASQCREGPFLALNCAALPIDLIESELFGYEEGSFTGASKKGRPGKFELADEGSLFLDEIDKMPLEMQVKLLRVLEERRVLRLGGNQFIQVKVRIIAASNVSLNGLILKGIFREDLYYRLNVLQINIPPLRDRKEDIPLLIEFFIREKSQRLGKTISGINPEALNYLFCLDFPGNVRQLENYIERATHFAEHEILQVEDFKGIKDEPKPVQVLQEHDPSSFSPRPGRERTLAEWEKEIILSAIEKSNGNLSSVSRSLGIQRDFLYRKIKKYGINRKNELN